MFFVSFKIPDYLRTSATGVRTSEKLRPLAPQDESVPKIISSPAVLDEESMNTLLDSRGDLVSPIVVQAHCEQCI